MDRDSVVMGVCLISAGIALGMCIAEADAKLARSTPEEIKQNRLERRVVEQKYQACIYTCQEGCGR